MSNLLKETVAWFLSWCRGERRWVALVLMAEENPNERQNSSWKCTCTKTRFMWKTMCEYVKESFFGMTSEHICCLSLLRFVDTRGSCKPWAAISDYIVCFVVSSLVDMFLSASMQVSCFLQIQNTSLIFHLNSCISVTSFCATPCIYSAHSVSSGMAIVPPAAVISHTGCRAVFSDIFIYLFSKRKVLIWT